jgi:hypothetical protein
VKADDGQSSKTKYITAAQFCSENLNGEDNLGDQDMDGKVILKWIVKK